MRLLHKWVKQAGISGGTAATLFDVVQQSRDQTGAARTLTPDQFAKALEGLIKQASTKDSTGQAGAYLVGDRVLRIAWKPFLMTYPEQEQWRKQLQAIGAASFMVASSGGEAVYAGDWLREAIRLDPHGPFGQRAVLMDVAADCASGSSVDNYHSFIERLDTLVASPADSEVKTTAQFLEADAYSDIFVLAHGFGKENADSTKFLPEADAAKVKAVALYQAALATDTTSRLARGGQLALDRLVSGQPLQYVRFFCLGE